jgi:hypothetical protein
MKRGKLRCCRAVFRTGLYLGRTIVFKSDFPSIIDSACGYSVVFDRLDDDDEMMMNCVGEMFCRFEGSSIEATKKKAGGRGTFCCVNSFQHIRLIVI